MTLLPPHIIRVRYPDADAWLPYAEGDYGRAIHRDAIPRLDALVNAGAQVGIWERDPADPAKEDLVYFAAPRPHRVGQAVAPVDGEQP